MFWFSHASAEKVKSLASGSARRCSYRLRLAPPAQLLLLLAVRLNSPRITSAPDARQRARVQRGRQPRLLRPLSAGGEFTRQAEVTFQPGNERLTIRQEFKGIDEHDHLVMSTTMEGRIPEVPYGSTVKIEPYSEIYQYSNNREPLTRGSLISNMRLRRRSLKLLI